MPTLHELLTDVEQRTFVGRDPELARFHRWLDQDEDPPAILNVVGRGGVGKTALVRAFLREAEQRGRDTVTIEGRSLRPEPEALLRVLGGGDVDEVAARLNAQRPLLVFDTFELAAGITGFLLDELLPRLELHVRTVVSGRHPLVGTSERDRRWRALVEELRLDSFTRDELVEYLARREVTSPGLVEQITTTTGGHPLATSMAADVVNLGATHLAEATDWRLAVRAIAEQLVRELRDPELRELLDAAALVRRFDEGLLGSVTSREDVSGAFERLNRLTMVRPAASGATLHDDVRSILADDLRWRAPDRYRELRLRALRHYEDRARSAGPEERDQYLIDAFFLMEESVVQSLVFGDEGEPGRVVVEPPRDRTDLDDVMRIEHIWHHEVMPAIGYAHGGPLYDQIDHFEQFEPMVRHPHARVRIARDRAGTAVGYSLILPLTRSTYDTLLGSVVTGPTVAPFVREEGGRDALPELPEDAERFHLTQLAVVTEPMAAIQAALWRDVVSVLFRGGAYSVTLGLDAQAELFEALGFRILEGSRVEGYMREHPHIGLLLDLRDTAVEDWVANRVMTLPPPPATAGTEPDGVGPDVGETGVHAGAARGNGGSGRATTEIQLLGDFRVLVNGEDAAPTGLPAQLLKLVAVRDEPHHVEGAAEVLWPDAPPGQGRTRLRNVLTRLREACGTVIERDGDVLRLAEDVEVDASTFSSRARQAVRGLRAGDPTALPAAREALAAYDGDLLPTDPYADWAALPRERLRRQLLALLDAIADDGGVDEAVRLLDRAIDVEPHDEARYVTAARLLLGHHRRAAAARVLRRAHAALEELGLPPSPQLRELDDALRSG